MALQTSGAISINDLHVEAGGTSGTTVSLNDSDIRALIGLSSGASNSLNAYYGASAAIYEGTNLSVSYGFSTLTTTSGKTTTTVGYMHQLLPTGTSISSIGSGNYVHGGGQTGSTVSPLNFMGSTGGADYNAITRPLFQTSYDIATAGSTNRCSFELRHTTRGQTTNNGGANYNPSQLPDYNANTSLPNGYSTINLTLTYGGSNLSLTAGTTLDFFLNLNFTNYWPNQPPGGIAAVTCALTSNTNIYSSFGIQPSSNSLSGTTVATNGVLRIS